MKKTWLILSLFMILALVLSACDQNDNGNAVPDEVEEPEIEDAAVIPPTGLIDPSFLTNQLDLPVRNTDGDVLGVAADLVIDYGSRQVRYVILTAEVAATEIQQPTPVPYGALEINPECIEAAGQVNFETGSEAPAEVDGCYFILDISQERLQGAPRFEPENNDFLFPDWDAEVREYWQVAGEAGELSSEPGPWVLARNLLEMQVVNADRENIASVADAFVRLDSGEIGYVLLFGAGEDPFADLLPVPAQALELPDGELASVLVLDVDPEVLAEAPRVSGVGETGPQPENWEAEVEAYWQDFMTETTP